MIPLGCCTMKLNATSEMEPISWPEFAGIHPFAPAEDAAGYRELAGLLAIRAYHRANGQPEREVCLIPSSAHGTNAASAVLAGMRVVVVACNDSGDIDLVDLKSKVDEHASTLAAIMVTYPSTHGVYENGINEITRVVHAGRGPGVGPIAAAPFGSASILPISWAYIRMMGAPGLTGATKVAVLAANYVAARLAPHYPVLYTGRGGLVAHECILDLRGLTKETGVTVDDVAKRLIDYGFHAPTMSFPVAGTLMVEPTESENVAELDRFCEAMIAIRAEIGAVTDGRWRVEDSPLRNAPHTAEMLTAEWELPYDRRVAVYPDGVTPKAKYWPPVRRIDGAHGDRNLICSCPSPAAYES